MKKKILIVDDVPAIVKLLENRLNCNGYCVLKAYNGIECIAIAEQECPDLILLDIFMPIYNGIETFNKLSLSNSTKDIPIIFMSAYPRIEYKYDVIKHGAVDYIPKPFVGKDLEISIKRILN